MTRMTRRRADLASPPTSSSSLRKPPMASSASCFSLRRALRCWRPSPALPPAPSDCRERLRETSGIRMSTRAHLAGAAATRLPEKKRGGPAAAPS